MLTYPHQAPSGNSSTKEHYDVIVVGCQTSGIIAAALLAKRGRRVLLVDHGESTSSYRHGGLKLPLLPHLVPNLEHCPHVQKVHDELGLTQTLRALLGPQTSSLQAVLPRYRVDIRQPIAALSTEINRELKVNSAEMESFLERLFELDDVLTASLAKMPLLPPNTVWEWLYSRRRVAELDALNRPFVEDAVFARLPATHPLHAVARGPLQFFGHLWTQTPSTLQAVRLMARYLRGVSALPDGIGGLNRVLLDAATRAGVSLRKGAVVHQIGVNRRRLTELEIDQESRIKSGSYFISNTHAPFDDLLPAAARHPRYMAASQTTAAVGGLLVVNLVVHKAVIPCGMARALFLLNGRGLARAQDVDDPPLLVQRFAPDAEAVGQQMGYRAENQTEVLSVACPVRVADVAHSPERLDGLKRQVLARMRRLVPFLDTHLLDVSLPSDTASWDLQSAASAAARRVDPWRLNPLYETTKPALLGVAARPVQTFFQNLVHCGRDVVPGLGLEGEYIAALGAVARLEKMAGRAWRL